MDELTSIFENTDRDLLQQLLTSCKGSVQGVVEYLITGGGALGEDGVPSPPDTPPPRVDGAPMVDAIIEQLKLRFPTTSTDLLYDVGKGSGSYQEAIDLLMSMGIHPTFDDDNDTSTPPPEHLSKESNPEPMEPLPAPAPAPAPSARSASPVQQKPTLLEALKQYYPDIDHEVLVGVAEQCGGSWSTAVSQLTAFGIPLDEGIPRELSLDDPLCGGNTFSFSTEDTDYDEYDNALATGDQALKRAQDHETSELMKESIDRIKRQMVTINKTLSEQNKQRTLGAQSCRGMTKRELTSQLSRTSVSAHSKQCFEKMLAREYEHCGTHVVFYHSYSFAALMYEVQAAIARVLYGLPEGFAALPRLLKDPYLGKPHLTTLVEQFASMGQQDHDPEFRQVAISVSVSLLAPSSEAPPTSVFEQGYSCSDLSFAGIMRTLLTTLGLGPAQVTKAINDVIAVGNRWDLYTSVYSDGNQAHRAVNGMTGHMIQMFIATDVVDDLAYASHAMGVPDPPRNPLSKYLTGKKTPDGQARVFVHPSLFLNPSKVKLYHYAANSRLHAGRVKFQDELIAALFPVLGTPSAVLRAYKAVEGDKKKKPKY